MTPSTTTSPSDNLHSDTENGGVVNQLRKVGGGIIYTIVETSKSLTNESIVEGKGRPTTEPTPYADKAKAPTPEALMGSIPTQGTTEGTHIENNPNVVTPNHVQPYAGSSGHEGFQEHNHSSPTPGSLSRS